MANLSKMMEQVRIYDPENDAAAVVYIDFGFSYAAVSCKSGFSIITKQSDFDEKSVWPYDVTEQLGYTDDESEVEVFHDPLDSFVQWLSDPRDRIELW